MKNIILFLLFVSTVAFGQTYPSPTFNVLTLQTPLSVANGGTGTTTGGPAQTQYSVTQYGAACDGVTNDSVHIQNAINAAQTAGGGLVAFPPGKVCAGSSTLAITANNVVLYCPAGGNNPNTNGPFIFSSTGCTMKWTGASGGAMVSMVAPSGSTSDLPLQGDGAIGMTFNGNGGLAGDGLFIQTLDAGVFLQDAFYNFSGSTTIYLGTIAATSSNFNPNATADSQWNVFDGIYIQNYIGAGGVASTPSSGMTFDAYAGGGALTVNASLNTIRNVSMGLGAGATGIVMRGDTNRFYNISIDAFASTAPSVDFQIVQNGSNYFTGSSNDFHGFVANNAVLARGQSSYPGCTSAFITYTGDTCTNGDTFDGVDDGNGTPAPTIEPGAQLMWRTQNGSSVGQAFGTLALGENQTDTLGAAGAVSGETLHVRNSAADHIILDNASGAITWGITFDGAGDLAFIPHAGASGAVSFAGGAIIPNSASGIRGTKIGDSANAGSDGEVLTSGSVTGVSLTNSVPANIASIPLTAGDWNVFGASQIACPSGTGVTGAYGGISTSSATLGAVGTYWLWGSATAQTNPTWDQALPTQPVNVTVPTTVYLVGQASFGGGACTGGGILTARRAR
jgi:hypothetical protein